MRSNETRGPSLAVLVAIALAFACGPSEPVKPQRLPTERADEPAPPPAPADTATTPPPPELAPSELIVGIDSAITRTGAPNHLRLSVNNPGDASRPLSLRGVAIETDGEPVAITVESRQLWVEGEDEPIVVEDQMSIPGGTSGELLLYLAPWDGDPRAERYDFEVRVSLPGVSDVVVPVTVTRANRDPVR